MKTFTIEETAKIQRKMMQLNPRLMAKVMAWNNMALEYDMVEEKGLQVNIFLYLCKRKKNWIKKINYD